MKNLLKLYPLNFHKNPANIIEPDVGASAWASTCIKKSSTSLGLVDFIAWMCVRNGTCLKGTSRLKKLERIKLSVKLEITY